MVKSTLFRYFSEWYVSLHFRNYVSRKSFNDLHVGFCPGPAEFKCCVKETGEPIPKIPEHNCKRHVIDAGYKILQKFPGYVKVVWCYANKPGEHGKGLALDFMVGVGKHVEILIFITTINPFLIFPIVGLFSSWKRNCRVGYE